MKKQTFMKMALLVFAISMIFVMGCDKTSNPLEPKPDPIQDPPKETTPILSVSKDTLDFGASVSSLSFRVYNSGDGEISWTAIADEEWISLSQTNGSVTTEADIVTLTVNRDAVNDCGDFRGVVRVRGSGQLKEVVILMTKEGGEPYIQFFEGNNATQDNVGGTRFEPGKSYNFKKTGKFKNDEARSMEFNFLPVGAKISVWDNPDGKTNDCWTEIIVKKCVLRYVVPTFEHSYEDSIVRVIYHAGNGLDGKVSRLEMSMQ